MSDPSIPLPRPVAVQPPCPSTVCEPKVTSKSVDELDWLYQVSAATQKWTCVKASCWQYCEEALANSPRAMMMATERRIDTIMVV